MLYSLQCVHGVHSLQCTRMYPGTRGYVPVWSAARLSKKVTSPFAIFSKFWLVYDFAYLPANLLKKQYPYATKQYASFEKGLELE
jgi:hypothetical protein